MIFTKYRNIATDLTFTLQMEKKDDASSEPEREVELQAGAYADPETADKDAGKSSGKTDKVRPYATSGYIIPY